MSFIEKARQAAEQARQTAGHGISSMTSTEAKAEMRGAASQVGGHVRGAADSAKRGLITAIEKIDPGILADVIIKATAIQEVANRSLRQKGSTYRIGEITITATIPPQIGFSIVRLGDEPAEEVTELLSSSELTAAMALGDPEVVALDGDVVEAVPADEPVA